MTPQMGRMSHADYSGKCASESAQRDGFPGNGGAA